MFNLHVRKTEKQTYTDKLKYNVQFNVKAEASQCLP